MRLAIVVSFAALMFSGCVFHSHKPPTATLTGRIIDCQTGEPVSGATACLSDNKMGTFANPDGTFVIERIPPGLHHLSCSAFRYCVGPGRSVYFKPGETHKIVVPMRTYLVSASDVPIIVPRPSSPIAVHPGWADQLGYSSGMDDGDSKLFREASAVHLENLRLLLHRNTDSLIAGIDPEYIDLAFNALGVFLGEYLSSALYELSRGLDPGAVVDTRSPRCLRVTDSTTWEQVDSVFESDYSYYRPGDVLVAYRSLRTDLFPDGWVGVYRFTNDRWTMRAGTIPHCYCNSPK